VNGREREGSTCGNAAPWSWLWSAGLAQRIAVALAGIGLAWLVILVAITAN